ncbi:MAG TPA: glycosyltransferase family 2 protein [Blastocatellia bacterium]|nr:glycosyltransferase family 2 protein [Blastocatellia bacterium]
MYRHRRIAVVMPIHDEEDRIKHAIARVPSFVDVIIAVDDASRDGTAARLQRIADERVVTIRHAANRGVGAATKTGYRRALATGADLIAVMDGDGQMDGRDLPALLDAAIAGADYVKGNRFLHRESLGAMPLARQAGNWLFSLLTRRAARCAVRLDAQCGYTVIRRAALLKLPLDTLYDRYGFPNEMLFAAMRTRLRIASVAVRSVYETEVSGINPLTVVPTIGFLIARHWWRDRLGMLLARRSALLPRAFTQPSE